MNRQIINGRRFPLLFVGIMLALTALTGCGSEQQTGSLSATSVPVSLNLSFSQQSTAVQPDSPHVNRLLTLLESWLPTATTAWARESVSNLSTIRVTVTGEGIQTPVTDEKQVVNPDGGEVITFELEAPQGANRIFTVDGFKNQLIIFTGDSAPTNLIGGQPASVDITLVDNTGTITGIVSNGVNIGATATMTVQGTTLSAPISNTGAFTLDGVPRGDHSLVVSAPGFITKNVPVVVPVGDTVSVGTIILNQIPPTAGIITGTVINADTQTPIQDATITVNGLSLSTSSTSSGIFTLAGVPVGPRTLTVSASGFSSATTPSIQVTAGNSSSAGAIALTPLPTTGSVTGTVSNASTRAPIPSATVSVNGLSLSTTTSTNGGFTLAGVPAGRQILTVSASGFSTSTTTSVQVVAGSSSSAGTIALTPLQTGSITGFVINADTQEPLSERVIQVEGSAIIARTLTDGSFTLEGIPQGSQKVLFSITGFQEVTRTVTVVAGKSVSLGTVGMPVRTGTGTLIGKIVVDDTTRVTIPDATVRVVVKATGASFQASTNNDGNFTIPDIPAGFVTITVSKPGFTSKTIDGSVKERTSDAGTIALTPIPTTGSITGTVVVSDASVPGPLQGAKVTVNSLSLSTITNSAGNFVFSGVPAGSHTLTVGMGYFISQNASVAVTVGGTVSTGIITLKRIPTVGAVTGTVVTTNGQNPVPITLVSITLNDGFSVDTQLLDNGSFNFQAPAGEQTITVDAVGFTTVTKTVSVLANDNVNVGTITLDPERRP